MREINKIYNMDCIKGMQQIDDCTVDLIVTSPPYNIGMLYDTWNDRMKWKDYWSFTEKWLSQCFRVLKNDGRICINHSFSLGSGRKGFEVGLEQGSNQVDDFDTGTRVAPLFEIHSISMGLGFKHHSVAIWTDRTLSKKTAWGSWLSAKCLYINSPYEGILIMYKNQWKKDHDGETTIGKREFVDLTRGIWNINTETHGLTLANYPIDLPAKCIKLLSYKGDLVLDPFMGSGTTALACKILERNYIGFEISEQYWKEALNRIDMHCVLPTQLVSKSSIDEWL
jgi:site-specific DNA-methyltransferase (adenine-specific)